MVSRDEGTPWPHQRVRVQVSRVSRGGGGDAPAGTAPTDTYRGGSLPNDYHKQEWDQRIVIGYDNEPVIQQLHFPSASSSPVESRGAVT